MISANFHEVVAGVYISDSYGADNISFLKQKLITHVLICCKELWPQFPDDFVYKKLEIIDSSQFQIVEFFNEAVDFIQIGLKGDGKVLVHCQMGKSRSVTIVVAYLIKVHRLSVEKSMMLLKKVHLVSEPNQGFLKQLQKFHDQLFLHPSISCSCSVF